MKVVKKSSWSFPYDHSELYLSIYNEDWDKQCSEESDGVQLAEVCPRPSSSHIEASYDLEQSRAYTMGYHSVSLDDQYDGVIDLPHHVNLYISPI